MIKKATFHEHFYQDSNMIQMLNKSPNLIDKSFEMRNEKSKFLISPIRHLPHIIGRLDVKGGSALKRLRQIVTKAVVAKGKKRSESCEVLRPPNTPTSILGCWVINHHYHAKKVGKYVEVSGKYDVNVWYAYNNHSKTAVYTETINYKDRIKLHYRDDEVIESNDCHVRVIQQPNCCEAVITKNGDCFSIVVEREFVVEVIGETKVVVSVHPIEFEEEWRFGSNHDESSSSSSSSSSCSSSSDDKYLNESSSFRRK